MMGETLPTLVLGRWPLGRLYNKSVSRPECIYASLSVLALARDGQITRFSPRALALITVLLAANGTVVDYADLIAALYGDSADGGPEYIMECLYKQKRSLAAKCGEIGIVIHSWYGVGMWLEAAGSAHAEMAA